MKKVISAIIMLTVLAGLQACTSSAIDTVKDGTLALDSSRTVGQALESYNYFSATSWKSFKDNKGREIVEFTGVVDYDKFVGTTYIGLIFTSEMIDNSVNYLNHPQMSFFVQFAVKSNRFLMIDDGLIMEGISKEGKEYSEKVPDSNMAFLKEVYNNVPISDISNILYRCANAK
jgi:hypothetical protein